MLNRLSPFSWTGLALLLVAFLFAIAMVAGFFAGSSPAKAEIRQMVESGSTMTVSRDDVCVTAMDLALRNGKQVRINGRGLDVFALRNGVGSLCSGSLRSGSPVVLEFVPQGR